MGSFSSAHASPVPTPSPLVLCHPCTCVRLAEAPTQSNNRLLILTTSTETQTHTHAPFFLYTMTFFNTPAPSDVTSFEVVLKLAFTRNGHAVQMRRVRLANPTIDSLKATVQRWARGSFTLQYTDCEGDIVTMDAEESGRSAWPSGGRRATQRPPWPCRSSRRREGGQRRRRVRPPPPQTAARTTLCTGPRRPTLSPRVSPPAATGASGWSFSAWIARAERRGSARRA